MQPVKTTRTYQIDPKDFKTALGISLTEMLDGLRIQAGYVFIDTVAEPEQ